MRFRSGIFRDCKRREGTGFPAKDTSSRQPRRLQVNTGPRATEPTLPGAGGRGRASVWAPRARVSCQSGTGTWGSRQSARGPLPRSAPSFPGAVPDEDAPMRMRGLDAPGRGGVRTWGAPFAPLK